MKRTPLKRSTTPIARSAMKPWRRPEADKMTGQVHAAILNRDRICFLYRVDKTHVCRDTYGNVHSPSDLLKLTVDHVRRTAGSGPRAPSTPAFGVAMCGGGNNKPPSKAEREAERAYLAALYPEEWA